MVSKSTERSRLKRQQIYNKNAYELPKEKVQERKNAANRLAAMTREGEEDVKMEYGKQRRELKRVYRVRKVAEKKSEEVNFTTPPKRVVKNKMRRLRRKPNFVYSFSWNGCLVISTHKTP